MEGDICAYDFRRGGVTEMLVKHQDLSSNMADLCSHTEDTAKKYYKTTEAGRSALKASKMLAKAMRRPEEDSCSVSKNEGEQSEDGDSLSKNADVQKVHRVWSEGAVATLRSVFRQEIADGHVTRETVRNKLKAAPQLQEEGEQRVLDKIRYEINHQTTNANDVEGLQHEAANLPKNQESTQDRVNRLLEDEATVSVIYPTEESCITKGSAVFDESHVKLLRRVFDDMITQYAPISKPRIFERLSENDRGKAILNQMTIDQIVSRIIYERKCFRGKKDGKRK